MKGWKLVMLFCTGWPLDNAVVYAHGSTIERFQDGSITFSNSMLPPGEIICQWYSRSDYLKTGIAPTLPKLRVDQHYRITFACSSDQKTAVQFRLIFFNDAHEVIRTLIETSTVFNFAAPESTAEYIVQMINLNHQEITFRYLSIGDSELASPTSVYLTRREGWVVLDNSGDRELMTNVIVISGLRSSIVVPSQSQSAPRLIWAYAAKDRRNNLIQHLLLQHLIVDNRFQVIGY